MKEIASMTENERVRCRKVVEVFTEFFEDTGDSIVVEAGKFGFIYLKWFEGDGFADDALYTDSEELFHDLWDEWVEHRLLKPTIGTAASELDYETLYKILPVEQKEYYKKQKQEYWEKCFGASGEKDL